MMLQPDPTDVWLFINLYILIIKNFIKNNEKYWKRYSAEDIIHDEWILTFCPLDDDLESNVGGIST